MSTRDQPSGEKEQVEESNVTTTSSSGQSNTEFNKAPRAAVACAACRARKIKCSGEHPICVTCRRSGQNCTYPPLKRRREPRKPFQRNDYAAESSSMGAKRRDLGQATIDREWQAFSDTGILPRATYQNNSVVAVQAPLSSSGLTPAADFAFLTDDTAGNGTFAGFHFAQDSPTWQSSFGLGHVPLGTTPLDTTQLGLSVGAFAAETLPFSSPENGRGSAGTPRPEIWAKASESPSNTSVQPAGILDGQKTKYRVPYFRFFGPTAIAPGYKKVVCDVTAPPSPSTDAQALQVQASTSGAAAIDSLATEVYGDCPSTEVLKSLLPLWQLHFGYFFPSLRLTIDESGRLSREVPHCLLNIMCSLAARYSPVFGNSSSLETAAASAWATKSKSQISQTLGFATADTILTLLMVSWYEFGQDRDGGLWMYTGMALRMGQDLGMDTYTELDIRVGEEAYQAQLDDQRLRCSLRMMDSILSIGTGRPAMYQASLIPPPTFPHLNVPNGMSVADPLPFAARIFSLADDMTNILVSRDKSDMKPKLERAQSKLNDFHTSLPVELQFETSTFQIYTGLGQGSIFVLLHLWFHTLVILAYQPSLILTEATKSQIVTDASKEVAASSAKTILDIATFAELIDAKAIAQPWINYPMYTAACVFLSQCLHATPPSQPQDPAVNSAGNIHMAKAARANFQRIVTILDKLQSFWHGVRYIRSVLLQKSEGVDQLKLFEEDNPGVVDLPPELAALWAEVAGGSRSDMVGLSLTGTMDLPYYHDPGSS